MSDAVVLGPEVSKEGSGELGDGGVGAHRKNGRVRGVSRM